MPSGSPRGSGYTSRTEPDLLSVRFLRGRLAPRTKSRSSGWLAGFEPGSRGDGFIEPSVDSSLRVSRSEFRGRGPGFFGEAIGDVICTWFICFTARSSDSLDHYSNKVKRILLRSPNEVYCCANAASSVSYRGCFQKTTENREDRTI